MAVQESVLQLQERLANEQRLVHLIDRIHSAKSLDSIFIEVQGEILTFLDAEPLPCLRQHGAADALGLREGRWRASARRSYLDVLSRPVFHIPYHLTDVQGVFEGWTPGGDRVSLTGYTGSDVLDLTRLDLEDFPLRISWTWGNDAVGARWTRARGDVSAEASTERQVIPAPAFRLEDLVAESLQPRADGAVCVSPSISPCACSTTIKKNRQNRIRCLFDNRPWGLKGHE